MKNFTSNSALYILAPVFLIASDFIATKFSTAGTSKAATTLGSNKTQPILLNHVYGSKFYNTNFKSIPKN